MRIDIGTFVSAVELRLHNLQIQHNNQPFSLLLSLLDSLMLDSFRGVVVLRMGQ